MQTNSKLSVFTFLIYQNQSAHDSTIDDDAKIQELCSNQRKVYLPPAIPSSVNLIPKEESDSPVRTYLRSFQSILTKFCGRVQSPEEMNQVFTYINHHRLRANVHMSTYLNKLHEEQKKLDHDAQDFAWEISGIL